MTTTRFMARERGTPEGAGQRDASAGNFGLRSAARYDFAMLERRSSPRRQTDVFFNRYVEGHPYLCRAVDLSTGGALACTFAEPDAQPSSFAVELRLPGRAETIWAWAKGERRGGRLAMQFVGASPDDRQRLAQFIGR
jgi:hypothetical protein